MEKDWLFGPDDTPEADWSDGGFLRMPHLELKRGDTVKYTMTLQYEGGAGIVASGVGLAGGLGGGGGGGTSVVGHAWGSGGSSRSGNVVTTTATFT